jgi:hypothetical protein
MQLPYPLDRAQAAGHAVFAGERNPRDVNLISVRHGKNTPHQGDDLLYAAWREVAGGSWTVRVWPCETEPGIPYLAKPMNTKGTAILAPGQYRKAWRRGLHRGRPALVQVRPVRVFRDADRDAQIEIDPNTLDEGLFGINIHDVRTYAELAGCTGLLGPHLTELLAVYDMTAALYGPEITYTLLESR